MTVVVGYVPTQTGFSAIAEAVREARERETGVLVVNIVGAAGYVVPTAADEREMEAVQDYLRKQGLEHEVRHIDDSTPPARILLGIANDVGARLIVLGLHQRSWLAQQMPGSTVRTVVLSAPCPVLVVPDVDNPDL